MPRLRAATLGGQVELRLPVRDVPADQLLATVVVVIGQAVVVGGVYDVYPGIENGVKDCVPLAIVHGLTVPGAISKPGYFQSGAAQDRGG